MYIKNAIQQIALKHDLAATLMPKPMYGEAGNGMHFHMLLKKEGRNILYEKGGYADLSQTALYFIGGILYHGKSLVALTNPSTNLISDCYPALKLRLNLFLDWLIAALPSVFPNTPQLKKISVLSSALAMQPVTHIWQQVL